jgi:D-arginine dehydrogenase
MVGMPDDGERVDQELAAMQRLVPDVRRLEPAQVIAAVPVLRPDTTGPAILEPGACDLDVHSLHQGFLRGARSHGARLVCDAHVDRIERVNDRWHVTAGAQQWSAPMLINAAGAWADEVAKMAGVQPIGLQPKRRSAFTFAPPEGMATRHWPMVIALDESWYFKPDAGALLGSPANADPVAPHDVQAEELDIATAIHFIEAATTLNIRRPTRVWAGLRSFVSDGGLVGGPAPDSPSFCWVAAQGGYGIQTCAAMGEACAALARGVAVPAHLSQWGVTAPMLSAARLFASATETSA